ncbi:MAG: hypothetical protein ACKO2Z_22600 [Sphaerospermopsis kisseleviana]
MPLSSHQSPVPSPQSPVTSPQSPVPSPQSPVPSPQSPVTSHQSPVPKQNNLVKLSKFSYNLSREREAKKIGRQLPNLFKSGSTHDATRILQNPSSAYPGIL